MARAAFSAWLMHLAAYAAELAATGITMPFFDDAGKLTHKLAAEHGTAEGSMQQLRDVEVVYFAAHDPSQIVQRVRAAEAAWDTKKETLAGTGSVSVATEANQLTGEGFDFALATSVLRIRRNFKLENSELVLTSDRAVIELLVERAGDEVRVHDVRRCEASGNLHVQVRPGAREKYRAEEAFSENAIYDGRNRTITFPHEVRILRNGRESKSKTFVIKLKAE